MRRVIVLFALSALGCTRSATTAAPRRDVVAARAKTEAIGNEPRLKAPEPKKAPLPCIVANLEDLNFNGPRRTFEGVVKTAWYDNPNGKTLDYVFLELDAPVCVKGDPDTRSVEVMQLVAQDVGYPPVGSRAEVRGTTFNRYTGYHVTPILLRVETFGVL